MLAEVGEGEEKGLFYAWMHFKIHNQAILLSFCTLLLIQPLLSSMQSHHCLYSVVSFPVC